MECAGEETVSEVNVEDLESGLFSISFLLRTRLRYELQNHGRGFWSVLRRILLPEEVNRNMESRWRFLKRVC